MVTPVKLTKDNTLALNEEGASLVEYALLVALIAIVAITAVSFLGTTACNSFSMVGSTIGAASPGTP